MKLMRILVCVAILGFVAGAIAGEAKSGDCSKAAAKTPCGKSVPCDKGNACCKGQGCGVKSLEECKTKCGYSGGCFPSVAYKVGDFATPCEKTALKVADEKKAEVEYTICGVVFDDKLKAMEALADLLEDKTAKVTVVRYAVDDACFNCPMEATKVAKKKDAELSYRLAGFAFASKDKAAAAADAAKAAMKSCGTPCCAAASAKTGCCAAKAKADTAEKKPCTVPCKPGCSASKDQAASADKKVCPVTGAKSDCASTCPKAKTAEELQKRIDVATAQIKAAVEAVEKVSAS